MVGRRGGLRSALDMAMDCASGELVSWLRADGAEPGEGSMAAKIQEDWQAQGWAVLQGFDTGAGEAARLKCSHELRDGAAKPL